VSGAAPGALDTCGCCESGVPAQRALSNRPGLDKLSYRVTTHGAALARMLAQLPAWHPPEHGAAIAQRRPLAALSTRSRSDPAIGLLDAWAMVLDVLAFYQERVANEGYLRTATERRSVLELARTIGYELGPGVAASAYLVFRVEDREAPLGTDPPLTMPPPPPAVVVPAGIKVQSIPVQRDPLADAMRGIVRDTGPQLPQTFETSVEIVARGDWNDLRPRLAMPQILTENTTMVWLKGTATGLEVGDRLLLTVPQPEGAGALLRILEVTATEADFDRERTRVEMRVIPKALPASTPPSREVVSVPPVPVSPPAAPPPLPTLEEPPKPTYILIHRPLTAQEILDLLLARWHEPALRAQMFFYGWALHELQRHLWWLRWWINLDPVEEWITIPPPPDVTPPKVASVFPAPGAIEVHHKTQIRVTFSERMKGSSFVSGSITLRRIDPPPGSSPIVADPLQVTLHHDVPTGTVRIQPAADLSADGAKYRVRVRGKVPNSQTKVGVRDLGDNELEADYVWEFETADSSGPQVTSFSPADGATNRPPTQPVTIVLDDTIDANTVTVDTFELRDSTNTVVPARLATKNTGSPGTTGSTGTITLTPTSPLARSTVYTVFAHGGPDGIHNEAPADGTAEYLFPSLVFSFRTEERAASTPVTELALYAFRETAGFFGHNAPRWGTLAHAADPRKDPYALAWEATDPPRASSRPRTIWTDSQGSSHGGDRANLERAVPGLRPGSWAVLESAEGIGAFWMDKAAELSLADYGLSGKGHSLTLSRPDGETPSAGGGAPPDFKVRETAAHVQSERLILDELPIEDPLEKDDKELILNSMIIGLDEGQPLAIRGEAEQLPGVIRNEIVIIKEVTHAGGFTILKFEDGLEHAYIRKTVHISANVAKATHGETIHREVLGGGDGATPNQRFSLRRPPLTHVSKPTPPGSESTLELRVNDILWEEARGLYDLGPRDERYVVRVEDDGGVSVVLGDGHRGARAPTGTENVVATYRTGIGRSGMVDAKELTLIQTRPLGIESVHNPLPATGAADPEDRDSARENAPRTVVAMDRIVSLRDFEDFARTFAGIGKALAVDMSSGDTALVHLTIAAANGDVLSGTSPLFLNLEAAIESVRDPGVQFELQAYDRVYFDVAAKVLIDERYDSAKVLLAVQAALHNAFSFARRSFGQPVTAAEVIAVIQGVGGVVATDLDGLQLVHLIPDPDQPIPLEQVLPAETARRVGKDFFPAQMLLVHPVLTAITEGTA
jgi:Bacterial Ig-like domain/Baseplate J-like protein